MRIYSAGITFTLLVLLAQSSFAQEAIFAQAKCTIVYSLERSANQYFNDEIVQLNTQIKKQNIHFIDLNNWRKTPPHIEVSGRFRNQLRTQFNLVKGINHAIVLNNKGQISSRYSGSVTLVNALMDCDYP